MPREIIVEFPSPLTDKEKKMIYGYKGEVVRCKDCTNWLISDTGWKHCYLDGRTTYENDYCSRGAKMDEENV